MGKGTNKDTLTPTLSQREREFLSSPRPLGEGLGVRG